MGKVAMIAHIDHGKTSLAAMVARVLADSPIVVATQQVGGICPKCGLHSGDDWSQCCGACPMPGSPHFVDDALFMNVATYDDYFIGRA